MYIVNLICFSEIVVLNMYKYLFNCLYTLIKLVTQFIYYSHAYIYVFCWNLLHISVEVPTEASYTTESNGKINIHVSVTINAGTLAELKKQRAQNRTSPDLSSVVSQATISDVELPQAAQVKRFSGEASENFIEDGKTRRCCSIL